MQVIRSGAKYAIQIIQEVAGTQLDKDLVAIFVKIPKEELVRCMPEEIKY